MIGCLQCDPSHNCERDGHIAAEELTPVSITGRVAMRVYRCGACDEEYRLPACSKCKRAVPLVKNVGIVRTTPGEARAEVRSGASIL